jgi:hypothetical protein
MIEQATWEPRQDGLTGLSDYTSLAPCFAPRSPSAGPKAIRSLDCIKLIDRGAKRWRCAGVFTIREGKEGPKMKRTIATRWILILTALFMTHAFAGVFFSVNVAPPAVPVYAQPPIPGDGYIWNPGYWQYGDAGYYWVQGAWVLPPRVGLLWTPGYWGWGGGIYRWHGGYWGPHVGYYGGVNYGHGYFGSGFTGGRWEGNSFHYNSAVWNVNNRNVHNTYVDHAGARNYGAANRGYSGAVNRGYSGAARGPAVNHGPAANAHTPHPGPAQAARAGSQHQSASHGESHGGSGGHAAASHPSGHGGGGGGRHH